MLYISFSSQDIYLTFEIIEYSFNESSKIKWNNKIIRSTCVWVFLKTKRVDFLFHIKQFIYLFSNFKIKWENC